VTPGEIAVSSADNPTPPPAVPPSEPPQYEFSEAQNQVIGDLANKMGTVGLVLIVLGVLLFAGGILHLFRQPAEGSILGGVVYILFGVWTRGAANSFQGIVTTQGRDISNLMSALVDLLKMYTVMYILILVVAVMALVWLLVVTVMALMGKTGG
jgi:hypothetical protein